MDQDFEAAIRRELRALRVYAAVATGVASLALIGAAAAVRSASFDVLTVHRINVVDANGTLRLAVFNKDTEPDVIVAGHTLKGRKGGKKAGILFYNDRGDEQGGLGYSGDIVAGHAVQGGLFSFDQFRQNDVLDLYFSQDGANIETGLGLSQNTLKPITAFIPAYEAMLKLPPGAARDKAMRDLRRAGLGPKLRFFAGLHDGDSRIALSDKNGRARLVMKVTPDGTASLQILDAGGKVTATFPQAPK
jgi:hypothetical protein